MAGAISILLGCGMIVLSANNWLLVADKTIQIFFLVCYERFVGAEEEDGIFDIGWLDSTIGDLVDLQKNDKNRSMGTMWKYQKPNAMQLEAKSPIPVILTACLVYNIKEL